MLDRQQPRKRSETRDRLLEVAESAVLAKGFAATSIEELIAEVGITKSGFFYHFKDKSELARALMERYLDHDAALLNSIFARGDELSDDPLHGFLVGLKLFAECLAALPASHPGCLAASFCYQDQLFDQKIRDMYAGSFLKWRRRFRARLDEIVKTRPVAEDVDLDALADMAATLIEGALVLGRALKETAILPGQILLYRDYVKTVFRN